MEATLTVTDRSTGVSRDLFFPPESALSLVDARSAPPAGAAAVFRGQSQELAPVSRSCTPGATTLCLLGNRYQVSVRLQDGPGGPLFLPLAVPAPVATLVWESGIAWFEDQDVPSLVVQLVDGRGQNGGIWVLIGGLSEEGFVVRVTDTVTGAVRRAAHWPGAPASVADLEAF